MAKLIGNVASFDITEVAHPAHEFLAIWIVIQSSGSDVSDARNLPQLLRARSERPHGRAAEQRNELAALHLRGHSISSSARPDSGSGTVMPSALAVLRLMISSTFVDCCTGRSAGFSPLRMRSM